MPKQTTAPDARYTVYQFRRVRHAASKFEAGVWWKGTMTLVTDEIVEDEVEAERDLETLVRSNGLPLFGGVDYLLSDISFDWTPTDTDRAAFGENITCVVQVGYRARVKPIGADEQIDRLKAMRSAQYDLDMIMRGGQDDRD